MTDWRDFPKLELHLHLEGAAPPPLVRRLAAEKGLDMVGVFDEAGHYNSNDFTSFLRTYERVSTVFSTPDDYRALTEAVLTECANNGVIYAEIFLSPTSLGYDPAKWTDYLAAIEEGADQAEQAHGIVARLIPVAIRHHGPEQAVIGAKTIMSVPRGRMTGFGIAGDERLHQPKDFAPAFKAMAEAGFRLTAHAGEFGGPESVRAALDDLKVERIGSRRPGGGRCRFAGQAGGRGTSAGNLPWFQRIAGRLSRSGQPLYRGVAGGWGEMHGFN